MHVMRQYGRIFWFDQSTNLNSTLIVSCSFCCLTANDTIITFKSHTKPNECQPNEEWQQNYFLCVVVLLYKTTTATVMTTIEGINKKKKTLKKSLRKQNVLHSMAVNPLWTFYIMPSAICVSLMFPSFRVSIAK